MVEDFINLLLLVTKLLLKNDELISGISIKQNTNILTVLTDEKGNLVSSFPGRLQ